MYRQFTDTHPVIEKLHLNLICNASVAKRISIMRSLTQSSTWLSRRAIIRANPHLNAQQLKIKFVSYYYGKKLAASFSNYSEKSMLMENCDLLKAIEPIINTFEQFGILYYIGGSVASSAYGIARSTMDIDMVSNLNIEHVSSLVKILKPVYYIDEDMILEAIKECSSFNIIHLETMLKIDIFINKNTHYNMIAFQRKKRDVLDENKKNVEFYLASPEDVILNKLIWFRLGGSMSDRQWNDVLGVIKVQKNLLDKNYLQYWSIELKVNDLLNAAFESETIND